MDFCNQKFTELTNNYNNEPISKIRTYLDPNIPEIVEMGHINPITGIIVDRNTRLKYPEDDKLINKYITDTTTFLNKIINFISVIALDDISNYHNNMEEINTIKNNMVTQLINLLIRKRNLITARIENNSITFNTLTPDKKISLLQQHITKYLCALTDNYLQPLQLIYSLIHQLNEEQINQIHLLNQFNQEWINTEIRGTNDKISNLDRNKVVDCPQPLDDNLEEFENFKYWPLEIYDHVDDYEEILMNNWTILMSNNEKFNKVRRQLEKNIRYALKNSYNDIWEIIRNDEYSPDITLVLNRSVLNIISIETFLNQILHTTYLSQILSNEFLNELNYRYNKVIEYKRRHNFTLKTQKKYNSNNFQHLYYKYKTKYLKLKQMYNKVDILVKK